MTEGNLSRYAAVFPGYSIDQGNVLDIGKHMSDKLFSADYPQYPSLKSLMVNPTLPVEKKFYSTDDNSSSTSSDEGDIISYEDDDDNERNDDSDTDNVKLPSLLEVCLLCHQIAPLASLLTLRLISSHDALLASRYTLSQNKP